MLDFPDPPMIARIEMLMSDVAAPMTMSALCERFPDAEGLASSLGELERRQCIRYTDLPGNRLGVQWIGPKRPAGVVRAPSRKEDRANRLRKEAQALRAAGAQYKEIANQLGVAVQTAFEYVNGRVPRRIKSSV